MNSLFKRISKSQLTPGARRSQIADNLSTYLSLAVGCFILMLFVVGAIFAPDPDCFSSDRNYGPSLPGFKQLFAPAEDATVAETPQEVDVFDFGDEQEEVAPKQEYKVSSEFLLGTDSGGCDLLTKILRGGRIVFLAGVISVLLSLGLGVLIGAITGFYTTNFSLRERHALSQHFQNAFVSLSNYTLYTFNALPRLVLIIVPIAIVAQIRMDVMFLAVGVANFPPIAVLVRDKVKEIKQQTYITVVRELGIPEWKILLKHILWAHCKPILIIYFFMTFIQVIMIEANLGYLGYALQGSWGYNFLTSHEELFKVGVEQARLWQFFMPALAVTLVVVALTLIIDALNKIYRFYEK